jgi:hypothetical protein
MFPLMQNVLPKPKPEESLKAQITIMICKTISKGTGGVSLSSSSSSAVRSSPNLVTSVSKIRLGAFLPEDRDIILQVIPEDTMDPTPWIAFSSHQLLS